MAELVPTSRRALLYLMAAFGITWGAWGVLVALTHAGMTRYGEAPFMTLYVLGGLGPTLAAYLAVFLTRVQLPPVGEFNQRVLRWRVAPRWYALALGLPMALAFIALGIAVAFRPSAMATLAIKPWYEYPLLFAMTIVGGGLEEFGWRGITQEEWGAQMGHARAAMLIGPVWAAWHLPLFELPGVSQYHGNVALFLLGVMGNALLLGWLYGRTRSILLCVFMHASLNAITMMGVVVPSGMGLSLISPCLGLAVGTLLFLASGRREAVH